ncbi:protein SUBSTANDARD STARCH GRAIN 4, chloroplastic [Zea mays]|uniref:protein SUBSTANDARD STARCH GRAIN 4, chloroplastic n=1 Tax=Zea mays TaxID=4577 RepID=UPI0009A972B7|nr:protein SUBSTANDARD STARCH GRAIN 4, chloroplastic [Zea mays]|eukprot:XP_008671460.2 uncharacterized protein LOC103648841 [Zea mays]
MAAVNLLAESAAVRLRAPAPPSAGEELAARLTECGFPATARRGGAVAGVGESARKWREMAARKEELLLRSRGRVAWTIVALCCGSHASHILHSLGIHVGHGELPRDIHSAAKVFESQLAESLLEGDGQLAFKKLATATLETLMPRIEGKGEFGQARWRLVYAPQIPSLLSVDPTVDPLKSLANNISFATEVEVQLGKRLQASVVRQMKDSEMAMQWTLIYQLTSRLRVLFQSTPSNRLLFEYSATSQE